MPRVRLLACVMLIAPAKGVAAAGLADIEKSYVDLLHALARPAGE